ncbi:YhgE/Pip family protein [Corynebacterium sp. L4756]|uniref:YhgE/Pip family protein n=1 Tax=unclassified Corynebacterium TaxID=2624378 RepID=UPI00374D46EF
MRTSWKILTRDLKRLGRVPKAWIILIGMLVVPALYSWFNIAAFWDPYGNTENIKVSVVNEDLGGNSDAIGHLDVGKQITEQLQDNDQLGWQIQDAQTAEDQLRRGDTYATIIIPENFTADLLAITEGTLSRPALEYRVNEKSSAIAPQITDTGATGVDQAITSALKQEIAKAAATTISDEGKSLKDAIIDARDSTNSSFGETAANLQSTRGGLDDFASRLSEAETSMTGAKDTISSIDQALVESQDALTQVQDLAATVQSEMANFTDQTTSAFVEGTTAVAEGTASARASVADINAMLQQTSGRLDTASKQTGDAIAAGDAAIAQVQGLLNDNRLSPDVAAPLEETLQRLEAGNAASEQLIADVSQLGSDTAFTVDAVSQAADAIDTAAQDTQTASQALRDAVGGGIPALNSALSNLSSTAGAFAGSLEGQRTTLGEANNLIDGVVAQLESTRGALDDFDLTLAGLEDDVQDVRSDILALTASSNSEALRTVTGLNPEDIGEFFASPVTINSEPVYEVNSYGSAMAGLFTNLSLWIGAFMLLVVFRVEVDTEGLKRVSVRQAYIGRFLLMAIMVALQAIIVTTGNLIIGVQTVNAVAFIGTAILVGLAYLSIIYALASTLGLVGKFIAVLLVIMQIPGASGLYPIELMPGFFKAIYPFLPFSYGIDALRETIGGFYGTHYLQFMGMLALMGTVAFILGVFMRKNLGHFNIVFNREMAKSELIESENVQVVGNGYRLADIARALEDREDFARGIQEEAERYTRRIHITAGIGVAGIIALAIAAWVVPDSKALLLGLWTAWTLLLMALVITFDYIRKSLKQSEEIAQLDEKALQQSVSAQAAGLHTVDIANASGTKEGEN